VSRRPLVAAAIVAACIAVVGCTRNPGGASSSGTTTYLEDVVPGYNAMLAELRAAIGAQYPGVAWREDPAGAEKVGGVAAHTWVVYSPTWYLDAPISDDTARRDEVVRAANAILHRHGFVSFQTVIAHPGQFEYVADDRWGCRVVFGGLRVAGLSYRTGDMASLDPTPQVPLRAEPTG
jgi:hypothetical protein